MKQKILITFALCILIILVCTIIGLIAGATIGGNYFTEFEAFGNRGYEATGILGALIGAVLGFVGAYFCTKFRH
jgi:hypothetical protein